MPHQAQPVAGTAVQTEVCMQYQVLSFLGWFLVAGIGKIHRSQRPVHDVFTSAMRAESTDKPQSYYLF